jgi:hypothetical protein
VPNAGYNLINNSGTITSVKGTGGSAVFSTGNTTFLHNGSTGAIDGVINLTASGGNGWVQNDHEDADVVFARGGHILDQAVVRRTVKARGMQETAPGPSPFHGRRSTFASAGVPGTGNPTIHQCSARRARS